MRRKSTLFILLGLLLLVAAGGVAAMSLIPSGSTGSADTAAQEPTSEPVVPVVVAQIDLPQGTLIDTPGDLLSVEEVPVSQFNEQTQFTDPEALRNMVTATDVQAGVPIGQTDVRQAGLAQKIPAPAEGEPSLKAFPIQVNSLSGVADLVQPGDFVDIVASFNMDLVTLRPGAMEGSADAITARTVEQTTNEGVAMTLLQDIEVLDVLRTALPAEGTEGTEGETATEAPPADSGGELGSVPPSGSAATTLASGNWMLIVAVTNQEAEVLRFALDRGIGITTVLRRTGDHTTERTVGATMRILIDNYGMPMPTAPQVVQQPGPLPVQNVPTVPSVDPSRLTPKIDSR